MNAKNQDIVRSVIFLKETFSRDTVIHTVTTTGEYQVGKDVVADKGNFARELPFQPVNGQEALRTETDDGYTTKLISMTTDLDADGFARNSRIKEIPATAFVVDMTHGKAKIPPRAGAASTPTPSSKSRFWWFTLNLAAIAGFIVYLWRKRSRSNPPLAGEFT